MSVPALPTIKCEDISSADSDPTGGGGGSSYNLSVNVNLGAVSNLLAAESASSTPKTPEILNSLIAMSNPLDQYHYSSNEKCPTPGYKSGNDSNSSMSNGSSASSPASGTPPSIQKTCSELIKAGLKLSIQSKRKMSGSDTDTCVKRLKKEESDDDYDSSHTATNKSDGLTPEDEERRRRRRERNKIAATKCRLKKRERTVNLVTESEVLESQNIELKSQLKDLELQKRQLTDMLQLHNACCSKNKSSPPPTTHYNMIRSYDSSTTFPNTYDTSSPYIRPESANILASSYTCITSLNGESSIDTISSLDSTYITPHLVDGVYTRPESVLSLPQPDANYSHTDGYLPKAGNLLVIEPTDADYYEPEVAYNLPTSQQCHTYPGTVVDAQSKINNGLNDGCLV